jgi:hypothetical protein
LTSIRSGKFLRWELPDSAAKFLPEQQAIFFRKDGVKGIESLTNSKEENVLHTEEKRNISGCMN